MNLDTLTITQARKDLDAKVYSAVELAQAYLKAIAEKNPALNAYLEVYDDVLAQAKHADDMIAAGKIFSLTGIPLAIKDNILNKGKRVGSASKILEGYVAPYDATVIEKLKKQGVVFLGRTNMDEFALGGSTENSAFGPTRNPYDISRVPGGTSGGSAAAVAAHLCLAALGSDTGGSIRQPASFCGVVGLKPTYGKVSRHGLMAATSSFDCIGPIAHTVEDAEILFTAIYGQDVLDATSINESTYPKKLLKEKMVIGIPRTLVDLEGIDPAVKENFNQSVEKFKKLGFEIKDIDLPNIGLGLAVYYILNFAEVSSNLSRFDGVKYGLHVDGKDLLEDYFLTRGAGFGAEARRRILLGTYVLSAGYYDSYYGKAVMARSILQKEFAAAFDVVDFVLTPTSPTPAWKIGEKSDPLSVYLADVFTVTANIVGLPGISLPSGFVEVEGKQLPLGVQLMAPHGADSTLFVAGRKFLGEDRGE